MKKLVSLFVFQLFVLFLGAQNLVMNGGFEPLQNEKTIHWWNENLGEPLTALAPEWVTPNGSTSDYWNSPSSTAFGYPVAKALVGEGRCGFVAASGFLGYDGRDRYKEYLMGRLTEPLQRDSVYSVSFYVALDHRCEYYTDSMGLALLSNPVAVEYKSRLPIKPAFFHPVSITSEDGWTKISGDYRAKGGEEYILIGSFSYSGRKELKSMGRSAPKSTSFREMRSLAYYYVDQVSVERKLKATTSSSFKPVSSSFLFLLDISFSMNQDHALDSMKNELARNISQLPSNAQVSIVTFSDRTNWLTSFSKKEEALQALQSVYTLQASGQTFGSTAIAEVYENLLAARNSCSVVLFTDGNFLVEKYPISLVKKAFREKYITFSVVNTGKKENRDLKLLAGVCGGEYLHESNSAKEKKLNELMFEEVKQDSLGDYLPVTYSDAKPFKIVGRFFMKPFRQR